MQTQRKIKQHFMIVVGAYISIALIYFILYSMPPVQKWIAALTDLGIRGYNRWGDLPLFCTVAAIGSGAIFCLVTRKLEKKIWGRISPFKIPKQSTYWIAASIILLGGWIIRRITNGILHTVSYSMLDYLNTKQEVKQYVFAAEIMVFVFIITLRVTSAAIKWHKNETNHNGK